MTGDIIYNFMKDKSLKLTKVEMENLSSSMPLWKMLKSSVKKTHERKL